MRNQLLIFFFLTLSGFTLSAQNGIGLFTRFLSNPAGEITVSFREQQSNILSFQGIGFEYRRNIETHKLYYFVAGFNIKKAQGPGYSTAPEVYLQTAWKLFKPLVNESGIRAYFSIGPRFFYMTESFMPTPPSNELPEMSFRAGLDFQIGFNVEYIFSEKIKFTGYINTIAFEYALVNFEIDNPNVSPNLRSSSIYNFDINLVNMVRVGFVYSLKNEDS